MKNTCYALCLQPPVKTDALLNLFVCKVNQKNEGGLGVWDTLDFQSRVCLNRTKTKEERMNFWSGHMLPQQSEHTFTPRLQLNPLS